MLLVFCAFILFLVIGMPVAFAIGISGALFFIQNLNLPFTIPIQLAVSQTQNFALLAVPLFIFAGNLLNGSGITCRLLDLANVLVGHMRGSLAQVNVILSTMIGGVSGSCIADAAMETRMLGPEMIKRGYSKGYTCSVNVWTSLITPIIPPGIGFILYGTLGQVSIGRLFAGGLVPGIVLTIIYMVAVSVDSRRKGFEPARKGLPTLPEVAKAVIHSIWAIIFPFALLFGLRLGIFTPSEIGAFAVVYAVLVGWVAHRELTWEALKDVMKTTTFDVGAVMFIIALSAIFGYGIVWERIPEVAADFLLGISGSNPYILIAIIVVFLTLAGMVVDGSVLILMLTPILLPIATEVGFDPVHFGLIFVLTITMGNMTPPVGSAMYAGCTMLDCSVEEYIRESSSFFIATIATIALFIIFPEITLWLPNLMFGKG
ncbi:MAG: TRAP transporter large permease subunit [Deltaproteobacteria bacterium]|nr:TRAP transporter large permease subunit [Deltaproteobacteria bacterium]